MKKTKKVALTTINGKKLMQKLTIVMFSIVIAIFGMTAPASANFPAPPPHPPPDCPDDRFIGPETVTETVDGCEITYTYWWRIACDTWFDMYISDYTIDGPAHCHGLEHKQILDMGEDAIVRADPWGAFVVMPCGQDVPDGMWRFFKANCWSVPFLVDPDDEDGERKSVACSGDGYCAIVYKYCWGYDINGRPALIKEILAGPAPFNPPLCQRYIVLPDDRIYDCILIGDMCEE